MIFIMHLPMFFTIAPLALGQLWDWHGAGEVSLKKMDKFTST